jgi:hypothetical protein
LLPDDHSAMEAFGPFVSSSPPPLAFPGKEKASKGASGDWKSYSNIGRVT